MEVNDKINLYFFNPIKTEDDYWNEYKRITGEELIAYSPLFLLRRQIRLLSGKIFTAKDLEEKGVSQIPYFSAILLSQIVISSFIELIYDDTRKDRYEVFYDKYLGKNVQQLIGLRALRNSLEHNTFQLYTRVYKNNKNNSKKFYDQLMDHLNPGSTSKKPDFLKIIFRLGDIDGWYFVKGPNLLEQHEDYWLVQYEIDPFRYLDKVESIAQRIHGEVLRSSDLKNKFDNDITVDNWMRV